MKAPYSNRAMATAVLLLIVFGLAGCFSTQPRGAPSAQSQNSTSARPTAQSQRPGFGGAGANGASAFQVPSVLSGSQQGVVGGDGTVTAGTYANLNFGTAGSIAKINVSQGERVTKGATLATLDTTGLDAALAQAQVALDKAEQGQGQAGASQATAEFNLDQNQAVFDIKGDIASLQWQAKADQAGIDNAESANDSGKSAYWTQQLSLTQQNLDANNSDLAAVLGETSGQGSMNDITQQYDSVTIQDAVAKELQLQTAQQSVTAADSAVDQAKKSLTLAQEQINEAKITAPFDGVVAAVNYQEGDFLASPSPSQHPVIYLVDPGTLELSINVNELDAPLVKVGQQASVTINAFPGVNFAGNVVAVTLVPNVQGGMVEYTASVAMPSSGALGVMVGMSGSARISTQPAVSSRQQSGSQAPSSSATGLPGQTPRSLHPSVPISPGSTPAGSPDSPALSVSGVGPIAPVTYANLNFGTAGQIAKIFVKQGQRVARGDVLAALDTTSLQAALAQAKMAVDQAGQGQTQANTDLATAELSLNKIQALSAYRQDIYNLQLEAKTAEVTGLGAGNSASTSWPGITGMYSNIALDKKNLSALLAETQYAGTVTYNILGDSYDTLTDDSVQIKQLQLETAQREVTLCQDTLDQAQKSLTLAQEQLDEATIAAPFGGVVAEVNYNEGDTLLIPAQNPKPVIYLTDPSAMELNVSVNELNIPEVKTGQQANVTVNAFPGVKIEGKVAAISPTPAVQGGIADYTVTIILSAPSNLGLAVGMNGTASIGVK